MMTSTKEISTAEKEHQLSNDVDKKIDVINLLDSNSLAKILTLLPLPDNQFLTQSYVEKLLLQYGIHLNELSLSKICTSSIMPIVAEHCKNLTRLEFAFNQRSEVNTDVYIEAFKKLDKLKFIKIKTSPLRDYEETKLDYNILDSLPEEINEIHLIHLHHSSETPVFFNLKKYKNLHSLTLRGCNLDDIIQQISEQIPLVYLDLKDSSVTDKCMFKETNIFNQLVNLEHFYCFDEWEKITPNSPSTMFNTCRNIKYFCGPSRDYSNSHSCHILPENWVNLESLEDFSMKWPLTDDLALKIVKYCKNLKKLHVDYQTTMFFLQKLAELKNLEYLEYPIWNKLDIESVNTIVTNCKKLKHLSTCYDDDSYDDLDVFNYLDDDDVNDDDDDDSDYNDNYDYAFNYDSDDWDNDSNDNTDYSDDDSDHESDDRVLSASVFDEISKLEYLEYLNVTYVDNFQDSSLIAIANQCKYLEYLNISHTRSPITKAGLNAITRITSLRRLNVRFVESVTNSFIGKLKGLSILNSSDCRKVSDVGFIRFIKNSPDLQHLFVRGTHMTIKGIIAADQATKYRKNNIVLRIHGCYAELRTACRSIIKSKWLIVSCPEKYMF